MIVFLAFSCLRAHEAEVMTQLARSQSTLRENSDQNTKYITASLLHLLVLHGCIDTTYLHSPEDQQKPDSAGKAIGRWWIALYILSCINADNWNLLPLTKFSSHLFYDFLLITL